MVKPVSNPLLNPKDPYRVSRKNSWVDTGGGDGTRVNVEVLTFALLLLVVVTVETDKLSVVELIFVVLLLPLLLLNLTSSFSMFSASDKGLWVFGSMPLCLSFFLRQEFHKFFISLSVLPGSCAAI